MRIQNWPMGDLHVKSMGMEMYNRDEVSQGPEIGESAISNIRGRNFRNDIR